MRSRKAYPQRWWKQSKLGSSPLEHSSCSTAPGFCSSHTACPAQPFWEKFMAANVGNIHPPSLHTAPQPLLPAPAWTLCEKHVPESQGGDAWDPTCFSVPLFASSHAWFSAPFLFLFFIFIEPEASGVQRTGSSLELEEEGKKKAPLAERCQQVAFSPLALPPPALFSAAPTEIWPPCHFLGSRPPRRARSAAGEEGTAWQGPCSFPKSA